MTLTNHRQTTEPQPIGALLHLVPLTHEVNHERAALIDRAQLHRTMRLALGGVDDSAISYSLAALAGALQARLTEEDVAIARTAVNNDPIAVAWLNLLQPSRGQR
jgi:hypothetical protein